MIQIVTLTSVTIFIIVKGIAILKMFVVADWIWENKRVVPISHCAGAGISRDDRFFNCEPNILINFVDIDFLRLPGQ